MKRPRFLARRDRGPALVFHAHASWRTAALEGMPLATFGQRAVAFAIDFALVSIVRKVVAFAWNEAVPHAWERHTHIDFTHIISVAVFVVYFTLAVYFGRGRTPGKRIAGASVVSLTATHPSFRQSFERALGYGASVVEAGLGMLQLLRNRNRQCAHDRLAETIVVDLRATPQTPTDDALPTQRGARAGRTR